MRKIVLKRGYSRGFWRIPAVAIALLPCAFSQFMGQGLGMPGVQGEPWGNGFGFYGVSAYAAYTSTAVPFNTVFPLVGEDLGPNYLAGGSASAGWQEIGARTIAHITYTISYDASIRYSSWNSLNHRLFFGVSHGLTPRLTWSFSGSAATMRWDQFLFEPTALSEVSQVPSTFDDLVQAILAGNYSNNQLASILTGAPVLESPASTFIYGTRFFTSALNTQLSYAQSVRLRIYAGASGSRTETLASDRPQIDGVVLVPNTTTVNAMTGFSYALTPLSVIGFETTGSRVFSRYENAYTTTGAVTAGRAFGRHWIANGRGGAGTYFPVQQTFHYKPGPRYVAGGGLTFKANSQTVLLQFNHSITDSTGFGAQTGNSGSGAWEIHRPGQRWAFFSQGTYTSLTGSTLSNVNAWLAGAGIARLDRHTTVRLAYMYGRDTGLISNTIESRHLQAVNLVVSWNPHPMAY